MALFLFVVQLRRETKMAAINYNIFARSHTPYGSLVSVEEGDLR